MRWFLVLLVVPAMAENLCAQGKLSAVRKSLTTPRPDGNDDHDHNRDDEDDRWTLHIGDDPCDDDDEDHFMWKAIGYVASAPFWIPFQALEDEARVETNFASYPYNHNQDGYLMFDTLHGESHRDDPWALRVLSEYGTDFDGLVRHGGQLFVETDMRVGIDVEWNHWMEDLGNVRDEMWTGDVNFVVRFAQSEHARFHSGLGLNWLSDETIGGENGFNFTYGFDLFPAKPFVLSSSLDWGRIDSSTLFHARSTVGVVYEHVELFAGYDYRELGSVDLSGFVSGLTIWW